MLKLQSYMVEVWWEGREKEKEEDEWSKVIVLEEFHRIFVASGWLEVWAEGIEMLRELGDKPQDRIVEVQRQQIRCSLISSKQEEDLEC